MRPRLGALAVDRGPPATALHLFFAGLLVGCGAPASPTSGRVARPAERVSTPPDVRVDAGASVRALADALDRELRARGHGGECFLVWAPSGEADLALAIGDRVHRARVSCGGIDGLATELEGRCPALRTFFVEGSAMRTRAVSLHFARPGAVITGARIAAMSAGAPAGDALRSIEGARTVLGIPLDAPDVGGAPADEPRPVAAAARVVQPAADPLADPATQRVLRELVMRIQRCHPEGRGSLVLTWRSLPDGTLTGAAPLTSNVPPEAVECAVHIVNATPFPEREGARTIDYCAPVLLAPALRPD